MQGFKRKKEKMFHNRTRKKFHNEKKVLYTTRNFTFHYQFFCHEYNFASKRHFGRQKFNIFFLENCVEYFNQCFKNWIGPNRLV